MADFNLFLRLGWVHIWEGYDHLLFLAALILFLTHWRAVLLTVTAFTAGHSLAMVVVAGGFLSVSPVLVESTIAFSIFAGALHNLVRPESTQKWILAGSFGLIHGAGFSGQLFSLMGEQDSALALIPALGGFFAGLEAGQLLFVGLAAGFFFLIRSYKGTNILKVEISRAIAASGLYLFVLRATGG